MANEKNKIPYKICMAAELVCKRFCITGVCDKMYICNVIAHTSKNGDGEGHFDENPVITNYTEIARKIQFAYSSLITYAEVSEMAYIMENLRIEPAFAIPCLKEAEKRIAKELHGTTDELRVPYLQRLLKRIVETRLELETEVA